MESYLSCWSWVQVVYDPCLNYFFITVIKTMTKATYKESVEFVACYLRGLEFMMPEQRKT